MFYWFQRLQIELTDLLTDWMWQWTIERGLWSEGKDFFKEVYPSIGKGEEILETFFKGYIKKEQK